MAVRVGKVDVRSRNAFPSRATIPVGVDLLGESTWTYL